MHPAYSVIVFTTASGAGYGLLFLLGLAEVLGLSTDARWFYPVALTLSLGLIATGLLSSMFHLGRPERAWRAFSQWRSSWLSREGVASVITFVPAGLMWLLSLLNMTSSSVFLACGIAAAALSIVTVYCTGMIYASLTTIRQWSNGWVAPIYLALALASGAVLMLFLIALFGGDTYAPAIIAMVALLFALSFKLRYWFTIDTEARTHTKGDATGLGHLGPVREVAPPHTSDNYLMKEMGFQVARKHARKLRSIALLATFVLPLAAVPIAAFSGQAVAILCAFLALASCAGGLVVERWLFFGEAQHIVTLYYGEATA